MQFIQIHEEYSLSISSRYAEYTQHKDPCTKSETKYHIKVK